MPLEKIISRVVLSMIVFFIAIPRQTKISLFNQRVCHQEAETCRDSLLQGNVFKKFTTLVVNLKSLTKCFYFQVLESITILEQRRLQGHLDMTVSLYLVWSLILFTVNAVLMDTSLRRKAG